MQVEGWMIPVLITLLAGYTAWMTRISVGLSRIERLQQDLDTVWARIDQHGESLQQHDRRITRLEPRTGDAG